MVYHEIRIINDKKMNYLISNQRVDGKWKKTAKFIGKMSTLIFMPKFAGWATGEYVRILVN